MREKATRRLTLLLIITVISSVSQTVFAATYYSIDNGLPYTFIDATHSDHWVKFNENTPDNPRTQVNVIDGGIVWAIESFNNLDINISGGQVSNYVLIHGNTNLNVSGGIAGIPPNGLIRATDNSTVTISGGSFDHVDFYNNTSGTITGGNFGAPDSLVDITTRDNSTLSMLGGSIHGIVAWNDSTVTVSGGSIGNWLFIYENATIYLKGTDFKVNGQELSYGDKLSNFGIFHDGTYHGIVTGTLADGSEVNSNFFVSNTDSHLGTGDIVIIPEPATLLLVVLGGLILRRRKT